MHVLKDDLEPEGYGLIFAAKGMEALKVAPELQPGSYQARFEPESGAGKRLT